jgi:hypothetical protein
MDLNTADTLKKSAQRQEKQQDVNKFLNGYFFWQNIDFHKCSF